MVPGWVVRVAVGGVCALAAMRRLVWRPLAYGVWRWTALGRLAAVATLAQPPGTRVLCAAALLPGRGAPLDDVTDDVRRRWLGSCGVHGEGTAAFRVADVRPDALALVVHYAHPDGLSYRALFRDAVVFPPYAPGSLTAPRAQSIRCAQLLAPAADGAGDAGPHGSASLDGSVWVVVADVTAAVREFAGPSASFYADTALPTDADVLVRCLAAEAGAPAAQALRILWADGAVTEERIDDDHDDGDEHYHNGNADADHHDDGDDHDGNADADAAADAVR